MKILSKFSPPSAK